MNRERLIEEVKTMVRQRGGKWSSSHRCAIDEILDLIDDKFLNNIEHRAKQAERHIIDIERMEEELQNKENRIKILLNNSLDDRGKKALVFADRLATAFREMDTDVMKCVSYGVWAYLGGDTKQFELEE